MSPSHNSDFPGNILLWSFSAHLPDFYIMQCPFTGTPPSGKQSKMCGRKSAEAEIGFDSSIPPYSKIFQYCIKKWKKSLLKNISFGRLPAWLVFWHIVNSFRWMSWPTWAARIFGTLAALSRSFFSQSFHWEFIFLFLHPASTTLSQTFFWPLDDSRV